MADGTPARLSPAELRRFALTVGGAFLAVAALMAWKANMAAAGAFGGVGALLAAAGVIVPARLGPVYRGWMRLALTMSRITTPILLGVFYFLVITPIGLVRRTVGQHPIRHRPVEGSYWKPRSNPRGDMSHHF